MKILAPHLEILRRAATEGLPAHHCLDEGSRDADVFFELIGAGYIAIGNPEQATYTRPWFTYPKITLAGREYLAGLEKAEFERSSRGQLAHAGRRLQNWLFYVAGALTAALLQLFYQWGWKELFK